MLPERNEIHLWRLQQSDFELASLQEYENWLTEDESARFRRFKFARHKRQLLLGRVLLRSVLSQYVAELAPAQWRFAYNQQGKPRLEPGQIDQALNFNLSHSGDCIVLAAGCQREIGVDIEFSNRPRRVERLVNRFFSGAESADLLQLPQSQQLQRFYQLWTLKEAYIKARGLGLALPLDSFSFSFPDTGRIEFALRNGDQASASDQWCFRTLECGADYACAIAVNGEPRSPVPKMRGWRMTGVNEFAEASTPVLAGNHS